MEDGVWRTVGGRRVFIKTGQSLSEAMKESGKFKTKEATSENLKEKQLEILLKHNPMKDDYHVGIRSVEDIKTFEEAMLDDESFVWGDYDLEDAKRDLQKGTITVYSSHEIKQGTFVSTSKNQAKDYVGGGKVKEMVVSLKDIAWINGDEGQYAKVK